MPIELLQFILLNCLSKPAVKPATKTCNSFAALLQNDLKSDVARNTTTTGVLYVSVIMLWAQLFECWLALTRGLILTRVSFSVFLSKALSRIIFSIPFGVSNHQIVIKEN